MANSGSGLPAATLELKFRARSQDEQSDIWSTVRSGSGAKRMLYMFTAPYTTFYIKRLQLKLRKRYCLKFLKMPS